MYGINDDFSSNFMGPETVSCTFPDWLGFFSACTWDLLPLQWFLLFWIERTQINNGWVLSPDTHQTESDSGKKKLVTETGLHSRCKLARRSQHSTVSGWVVKGAPLTTDLGTVVTTQRVTSPFNMANGVALVRCWRWLISATATQTPWESPELI